MPTQFSLSTQIKQSDFNLMQSNLQEFQNIINNINPMRLYNKPINNKQTIIPGYILEGNYQIGTLTQEEIDQGYREPLYPNVTM